MAIYLDNNATTPLAPEVVSAIRQACEDAWANPSSGYKRGREAKAWVLCFKFSLNPLRFSLTREIDTKMTVAKSWTIGQLQFLNNEIDQNTNFANLTSAKWLYLYEFTSYLQLLCLWLLLFSRQFLSWENFYQDWEENLTHKNRALDYFGGCTWANGRNGRARYCTG